MTTSYDRIAFACDRVAAKCTMICGGYHGSAYLFDKVMRVFDNQAICAVTYPVYWNLVGEAYATITRDGRYFLGHDPEPDID